ncbi:alpha amylase C-terminal domain-containing protein, partial [bacterium]|nr:alpha amylase C-terminal domain-containing protein [bacterium]
LLLGAAAALPANAEKPAAGPDNNIEWNGVSHIGWLDRSPRCPIDGESFTVTLMTYANDITSARVLADDGTGVWTDASKTSARGPYDIWTATVPATASDALSYWFEITDGAETDYLSVGGMMSSTPTDGGFVVDFATLEHAPVGATPTSDGGTVFRVWSPDRTTAHVRGAFNGWDTSDPMTKTGEHFAVHIPEAQVGQMYKYFFQSTTWNTDPRARRLNPGDNYNAFILDPGSYAWQIDDFDVPDFEEMVIYQLHVGTFAGRNDPYGTETFPAGFAEVTERVDHLAELGVNVVMINPVTEFPWDYSAGYNPITAWSPEWIYGTPDELKAMVDALHDRGIATIHDIVWNHFSFSDNFLWNYDGTQLYFDDPAIETPWGSQADFDSEGVRDYYVESAFSWLDEFRMDGFRMDATSYMNIAPQEASGWSLMQRLNDEMDRRAIDKICIAEQLPDNSWVTRPTSLGGAGFDSQYYDEFTDRLRDEIFDAASGDPEMWKIRNIINGGGLYLAGRYATNYVELHDECWPSSGGQRIVKTIDTTAPHDDQWAKGRVKLSQGLVLTSPGIPAMLMGTEWLEDTDFGTDSGNRIDWSKKTTYAGIFDYFSEVITLRTSTAALRADAGHDVFHLNESGNLLAFQRWDGSGGLIVVVANFSNTDYSSYRIGLPSGGNWTELVNSQDAAYMGSGTTNPGTLVAESTPYDGFSNSIQLSVPAMALLILSNGVGTGVDGEPPESGSALWLAPRRNPMSAGTEIALTLPAPSRAVLAIYDVRGRRVTTVVDADLPAGTSSHAWHGRDDAGRELPSGVYFARLTADAGSTHRKLVLLR